VGQEGEEEGNGKYIRKGERGDRFVVKE